jgi:hypothetical protein
MRIKLCFSSSGTHRCQYLWYLAFILKYQCFVFKEGYVNVMTCLCLISRAIIIIYLTANGLSPSGSGYNACT